MEGRGNHVHRLALTPGGFGHVAGDAGRAVGGAEDLARRTADVLDQAADGAEELVEPAGQLGGFVAAADLQVAGQVAFALGDVLQAAGDAVDRAHDELGERRAYHGEHGGQDQRDDADQPGKAGGGLHHFVLLDQADEGPAEFLVGVDVGHVALAVQLHFGQALAGLGQLGVAVAQAGELLEVVAGVARVDHHVAVVFHEDQVAALAQLDLLDDFGKALERHIDVDHAARVAQRVGHGAHGADQHGVVAGPVVGGGAQGFAGVGHGRLVPGASTRVIVGHFRIARPERVAAVLQAIGHIGVVRVALGQAAEQVEQRLVLLAGSDAGGIGADVLLDVVSAGRHQGLRGQVVEFVDGIPGSLVADPRGLGGAGDGPLLGDMLQQGDALWAAGDVLGEQGGQ